MTLNEGYEADDNGREKPPRLDPLLLASWTESTFLIT